ncbi:hypothetical protein FA15DRAFT_670394 [Coprinopsis marcescibilis]|uniref:CFEM domain-containing protein n=1 Tax=Coprinopsis marcescibilis TaxID=230819 RepID=A0A5C3KT04_COPMA|nr:hypothetical protein FA15DRAFT_670394 [Coprinopsis marcescibilis]
MIFANVFIVIAAAGFVTAQIPGVPQCVQACASQAAPANGCSSFLDIPCICGSAQFAIDSRACLLENCSPEDLAIGESLQQNQCNSITATGTTGPPRTFTIEPTGTDPASPSGPSGSDVPGPRPSGSDDAPSNPRPTSGASIIEAGWVPVAAAALAALAL